MAATENSANTLKINIVADANPAKQALAEVGKAAIETKEKLSTLSGSFGESTKKITELTHDVKTLRLALNQDFSFKGIEESLGKITARLHTVNDQLAKNLGSNITRGFTRAEAALDRVLAKAKRPVTLGFRDGTLTRVATTISEIQKKYAKPINIFAVDQTGFKKIDSILDRLDKDRTKRIDVINQEINLLRQQRLNYITMKGMQGQLLGNEKSLARLYKSIITTQGKMIGPRDMATFVKASRGGVGAGGTGDKALVNALNRNTAATVGGAGGVGALGYFGPQALKAALDNINTYQQRKARVDAWNLSSENQQKWRLQANELVMNNKLISRAEAESMMMAASSSLGHYDPDKVGKTVGAATKYAQLERVMGYNKSEADDIVKNYYGVAEARQVTDDVTKVLDTFKTVFNITTTTAGKISVADIETIMRNMGPGAATISDEGLLRLLAYAEQIKVAGKGSSGSTGAGISTVGTNVKMLQLMAMGKPSSINAKKTLAQLGLMDDDVYQAYNQKTGDLVLRDTKQKGAEEARNVARAIFERGDVGQVLGEIQLTGTKKLAQAGVYTKEMAQKDPVAWVENITKLIEGFVVKAENRGIYFGKVGQDSAASGETDDAFYQRMGREAMTGAITTFWAKTGLSQRVLTALSTFSNEGFQERSKHMMETAQNQKSADDLMKSQVEAGNLALATEMLRKSIIRLTEAFEPMTSWIGKAAVVVSEVIDKITDWVNAWQGLASTTAGWVVIKTLIASLKMLGVTYDEVTQKELKSLEASKLVANSHLSTATAVSGGSAKTKAVTNAKKTNPDDDFILVRMFTGFNEKLDAAYGKVTGWAAKVKSVISTIGVAMSKCVTIFGAGLLAVDIGTMAIKWMLDFTKFGQEVKSAWDKIVDYLRTTKVYATVVFDKEDAYSDEDQKKIDEQGSAYEQAKQARMNYEQKDGGIRGKEEIEHYGKLLDAELKAWKQLQATKDKPIVDARKISEKKDSYFAALKESGLIDALKEAVKGQIAVENKAGVVDNLKNPKALTDPDKEKLYYTIMGLLDDKNKKDEHVLDLQKDSRVVDALNALNKEMEGKSKAAQTDQMISLMQQILTTVTEGLNPEERHTFLQRFAPASNDKAVKERIEANFDKAGIITLISQVLGLDKKTQDTVRSAQGKVSTEKTRKEEQERAEAARKQAEEERRKQKQQNGGYSKGPTITDPKKMTRVQKWLANNKKVLGKYQTRSLDADDFESWEETRARMKEQIGQEILAGKFGKGAESPFIKPPEDQNNTKGFTLDDVLWNVKSPEGVSANDLVDKATYSERVRMFTTNFGSMMKSASENLRQSIAETEKAKQSLDDFSAFYNDSDAIKEFDAETERQRKAMNKYGVATKKQKDKFEDERKKGRADLAKRQLYTNMRSDKTTAENSAVGRMTTKQALTYNYEKSTKLAEADYTQTVRQIQESIKQGAITQQEGYALLTQYEQQYLEASRARYQDYYDDLTGYSEKYLDQKIEDWQDLGKHMQNMQNTIMDGFVSANEKWLDGDKNSWRDYCNDILKMWRNMAMKMGYSQLLGGLTKGITNGMTDFLSGAFDKEKPKDAGALYDWGNSIWKWVKGDEKTPLTTVTQPGPLSEDQMASNTANGLTGQLGYGGSAVYGSSYGWDAGGNFGLSNNNYANNGSLMNAGMGNISGTSSLMTAGSESFGLGGAQGGTGGESAAADKASQSLNSLASSVGSTTGAMGSLLGGVGSLAGAFGANQETVQSLTLTGQLLNTTSTTYNSIQQLMNALGLTQTETQGSLTINLAILNLAVVETIKTFAEMWTEMQMAKAQGSITKLFGATASANGNIMTDHGPLPLQKYSNGGIAKSAQISIFGEGRTPEAYVPLPDGRSIPVTLNAGNNGEQVGGNNVSIVINVTGSGDSTSETQDGTGSDGNKSLDDSRKLANAIKTAVKNEIYNQSRPGGMLYNR